MLFTAFSFTVQAKKDPTNRIRFNQLGFYPNGPKVAVITLEQGETFYVTTPDFTDTVFTGKLTQFTDSPFSDKKTRIADFTDFRQTGTFVVSVEGLYSRTFQIQPNLHKALADAAIKSFYFQRVSTALPEEFAGKWNRPMGHPDNQVVVHSSAASPKRPAGTIISSSRGWYDAGDYNKYIVNSGITTGTLLSLYEDFPEYVKKQNLNIPESRNNVPDLLDEALWNIRWMLTMQDPVDGGVYHKLTTPVFEGMIMPVNAKQTRYVVQKGTAATLDFAAVMAQAARVYKNYEQAFPGLADSLLTAATKAWTWAEKNPNVAYDQGAINNSHTPQIHTGAYGDGNFEDEKVWAAAELFITTGQNKYLKSVTVAPNDAAPLPSWAQVKTLGYYSLIRHENKLGKAAAKIMPQVKANVMKLANNLAAPVENNYYRTMIAQNEKSFGWGSNSTAANQSIAQIYAYKITGDKKYINNALTNLDYIMGRNATDYSFVTGFGHKTPMYPHHRLAEADGIAEPIPGFIAGGVNPEKQDGCYYPSPYADEVYVDDVCSYASNEIAINWNAPFAYLTTAMEALQQEVNYSSPAP
ncbi:cellulose 1,4-beta-cellobiosidase [Flammeovirgaceae bacterium 311]|nr:cellulose 1,4-beta-cellobiosidase [Flammeovirgaceae bacterium 311]